MEIRFQPSEADERTYRDLTPGNRYTVIGIEYDHYRIISTEGLPYLYPGHLFEVIDPSLEGFEVEEVEGGITAYPPEFNRPGFFEDFFDHDPASKRIFRSVVPRIVGRSRPI